MDQAPQHDEDPGIDFGDDLFADVPLAPSRAAEIVGGISTSQTGRTFQDRSYVFNVAPRP